MRFNPVTLAHIQTTIARSFQPPFLDHHRPYVAMYVRRSDKVQFGEMSRPYSLQQYFQLFDYDAHRGNIRKIYINSEDDGVFDELRAMQEQIKQEYHILSINFTRNIIFRSLDRYSRAQIANFTKEFLTDLYIEVNADLHVGTLTSNWCRLVDEIRLVLGKFIPFYTPENKYLIDW